MAKMLRPVNRQRKNSTEASRANSFPCSGGRSGRSGVGSSSSNMTEIVEEGPFGPSLWKRNSLPGNNVEEKVFVAVGKKVKESLSSISWTLQEYRRLKKLVLVHVHRPSPWIPSSMGAKFPASQVESQQVIAYRRQEKQILDKTLDEYESFCKNLEVERLVIEMDDVARGLVELIVQNGITQLIMGAAANKHYTKKMKSPKSKTACIVQEKAPLFCQIWFVCNEKLICTRKVNSVCCEATASLVGSSSSGLSQSDTCHSCSESHFLDGSQNPKQREANSVCCEATASLVGSSSSGSLQSDTYHSHSESHFLDGSQNPEQRSGFDHGCSHAEVDPLFMAGTSISQSRMSAEKLDSDTWDGTAKVQTLEQPLLLNSSLTDKGSEDGSIISQHSRDDFQLSSTQELVCAYDTLTPNDDLYHQLERAIGEAADLKDEVYAESCQRLKAEKELWDVKRKAKASEIRRAEEMKFRKQIQKELEREKLEIESIRNQRDETFEQLRAAQAKKTMLESHIIKSDLATKDLEQKLSAARNLLNALKTERDQLQHELDNANRELKELHQMKEKGNISSCSSSNFSHFTSLELEQATHNFESSSVIGQGGYGRVYKGYIRQTPVAIKILHPDSLQGQSEFHQEVDILSRVRHPNLVTLVGACSELRALVYEFLPKGSLEDHLMCKNGTSPLPWQFRIRICYEVCCALVFLHLARPSAIVHGDLKPANILLDANLVSKLGDFGISRFISPSATATTTLCHNTIPKGTPAYMDPEFQSTGDLTPRSDVYSFGIVLLRLLSGRRAFGIAKEVREAVDKGKLQDVLDPTAGDWPIHQAEQLAYLGIRCCELNRKNRPDLKNEVWRLEKMKDAPLLFQSSLSLGLSDERKTGVPSYFICPISKDVMKDPCLAADGYTYESEAFRKWLESGKKTSPKTKLSLSHDLLTPNRALREAIQDWLQQRQA